MKLHAADFNGVGGKYALSLVLGDARAKNPINWKFAELSLKLAGSGSKAADSVLHFLFVFKFP